jgi:hypothetical protein
MGDLRPGRPDQVQRPRGLGGVPGDPRRQSERADDQESRGSHDSRKYIVGVSRPP